MMADRGRASTGRWPRDSRCERGQLPGPGLRLKCNQYCIRHVGGVVRGLRVRAHSGEVGTVTWAVHVSWCTLAPGRWSFRAGVQREDACDIVLCTSRLPSYLPGGGWPQCRSARAFLGPQLVARATKTLRRGAVRVFGMLRADHFVNDNQQGQRTRRKGWPRDASAQRSRGRSRGIGTDAKNSLPN